VVEHHDGAKAAVGAKVGDYATVGDARGVRLQSDWFAVKSGKKHLLLNCSEQARPSGITSGGPIPGHVLTGKCINLCADVQVMRDEMPVEVDQHKGFTDFADIPRKSEGADPESLVAGHGDSFTGDSGKAQKGDAGYPTDTFRRLAMEVRSGEGLQDLLHTAGVLLLVLREAGDSVQVRERGEIQEGRERR